MVCSLNIHDGHIYLTKMPNGYIITALKVGATNGSVY